MSIKNIQNDNNKSWLDAKFGSINAKQTNVNAGVTFKMDSDTILYLQGQAGNPSDKLELNSSLEPVWISDAMGEAFQHAEYLESSTFATTSATYVPVPGATFTTTDLGTVPRTYVLFFEIEMNNIDPSVGGASAKIEMTTPTPSLYRTFFIKGNYAPFHNCCGYNLVTLTGVNTFDFYVRSVTGGQTTTVQRVRYSLYMIA